MRHKGLDEEAPQDALDRLDLDRLACSLRHPLLGLGPGLVQGQEAALAPSLDQLIGLRDELGVGGQQPGIRRLGLVQHARDVGTVGEVDRRELRGRVVRRRRRQRRRLDDGRSCEVVVQDGLAIGFEDGFGRHDGERLRQQRSGTPVFNLGKAGVPSASAALSKQASCDRPLSAMPMPTTSLRLVTTAPCSPTRADRPNPKTLTSESEDTPPLAE